MGLKADRLLGGLSRKKDNLWKWIAVLHKGEVSIEGLWGEKKMDGTEALARDAVVVSQGCGQYGQILHANKKKISVSYLIFRASKRGFDIVASLLGLVLLFPVFLLTVLAIKAEDGGKAIYRQDRNGLNGEVFCMYKFRSMCMNAEQMHQSLLNRNELDGPAFKLKDDPRVTKVGKFLRRTSIDELPQLINILKGEMSFVGPRPLPVYETEQCNDYQKQRLLVKPGLTCYWQCSGRNNIPFDEWIELDLKYIREASLWVDFKILCRTVVSVIYGDGAY
ncbi:MAG: sugar transferase [Eubacterium sp.]|nr:sugar transferase [Eubacterium sp.]